MDHEPTLAPEGTLAELVEVLRGKRITLLTGAGCSTESGIPDYRGEGARYRPRSPIQHHEFVTQPEVRQRYWARSVLGWPRFRLAKPNAGHDALAAMERAGLLEGLITQNVDGLHGAAGNGRVIELHGALARVVCLGCGATEHRDALQARLAERNPGFVEAHEARVRPDGDAELDGEAVRAFRVAECRSCGRALLMPDVVFFGGSVPKARVEEAYAWVDASDALLVVGTSLQVFSGYRFVLRARDRGIPVAVANVGPTRGDALARVRVNEKLGALLPALARGLGA